MRQSVPLIEINNGPYCLKINTGRYHNSRELINHAGYRHCSDYIMYNGKECSEFFFFYKIVLVTN